MDYWDTPEARRYNRAVGAFIGVVVVGGAVIVVAGLWRPGWLVERMWAVLAVYGAAVTLGWVALVALAAVSVRNLPPYLTTRQPLPVAQPDEPVAALSRVTAIDR